METTYWFYIILALDCKSLVKKIEIWKAQKFYMVLSILDKDTPAALGNDWNEKLALPARTAWLSGEMIYTPHGQWLPEVDLTQA